MPLCRVDSRFDDELYKYVLGCQDVNMDSTKDMRSWLNDNNHTDA